jgi:hypothetical protein
MNEISNKALMYTVGIIISAVISFYLFWSGILFIWLNTTGAWVTKSGLKAFGSLVLAVIFFGLFLYFISKVKKLNNERNAKT